MCFLCAPRRRPSGPKPEVVLRKTSTEFKQSYVPLRTQGLEEDEASDSEVSGKRSFAPSPPPPSLELPPVKHERIDEVPTKEESPEMIDLPMVIQRPELRNHLLDEHKYPDERRKRLLRQRTEMINGFIQKYKRITRRRRR